MRTHFAIAFATACFAWPPTATSAAEDVPDRPATLQPPSRSAVDVFTAIDSAPLGLRRPPASMRDRIDLPFGLNYSRDAKSLLMPLDERNEWGLGINLNLNATPAADFSPPGLHLAPKRAPGLMLQKKF